VVGAFDEDSVGEEEAEDGEDVGGSDGEKWSSGKSSKSTDP
jgi:hypothetical protein